MKNSLVDLNNHLFAQIERLSEEGLDGEELKKEVGRAKSMVSVSSQIVNNGRLMLDAAKFRAEYAGQKPEKDIPDVLGVKE